MVGARSVTGSGHGGDRNWTSRAIEPPRRTYLRTALPLLALSLAPPLTAADTASSTKLTLAAAHLIAGAIIIPAVARRLGAR